jgi:hypothetical protein
MIRGSQYFFEQPMSLCSWRVSLIVTKDINMHRAKSNFELRMSAALWMTCASHMKNIYPCVSSEKKTLIVEKSSLRKKKSPIRDKNSLIREQFLRRILKEMVVLCSVKCKQARRCTHDLTFLVSPLLLFISKTVNIYTIVRSIEYIAQQFCY